MRNPILWDMLYKFICNENGIKDFNEWKKYKRKVFNYQGDNELIKAQKQLLLFMEQL